MFNIAITKFVCLLAFVFFSLNAYVKADNTATHIIVTGYDERDSSAADRMLSILSSIPSIQNKAKKVRYNEDIYAMYPNAQVVIFSVVGMEWIMQKAKADSVKKVFSDGKDLGKHFFIYGDTYMQAMNAIGDNFFEKEFSVKTLFSDLQYKTEYMENKGYKILPFDVNGKDGDILGDGLTLHANIEKDTIPAVIGTRFTNTVGSIISLEQKVEPFLYYNNETQNIAGVRVTGEKTRATFLGFRVESIESEQQQISLVEKVCSWLTGATSDIKESTANNALTIEPNPCNDYIDVMLPSEQERYTVKIFNVQGNLVNITSTSGNIVNRIDLSPLDSGVYSLQVKSDNNIVQKRFVIVR